METLGAATSALDFDVALLKMDEIVKGLGGDRK